MNSDDDGNSKSLIGCLCEKFKAWEVLWVKRKELLKENTLKFVRRQELCLKCVKHLGSEFLASLAQLQTKIACAAAYGTVIGPLQVRSVTMCSVKATFPFLVRCTFGAFVRLVIFLQIKVIILSVPAGEDRVYLAFVQRLYRPNVAAHQTRSTTVLSLQFPELVELEKRRNLH